MYAFLSIRHWFVGGAAQHLTRDHDDVRGMSDATMMTCSRRACVRRAVPGDELCSERRDKANRRFCRYLSR
jgi:hypothetical protein